MGKTDTKSNNRGNLTYLAISGVYSALTFYLLIYLFPLFILLHKINCLLFFKISFLLIPIFSIFFFFVGCLYTYKGLDFKSALVQNVFYEELEKKVVKTASK